MANHSVLVTGSSGTVGTRLVQRLLKQDYIVHGVDINPNPWSERVDDVTRTIDLCDPTSLDKLPEDVDTVIHLAAHARVHQLVEDPRRAQENVDMTFNVLEYARQTGVSNVIFSSSREVYGNGDDIISSESDTFADECESPYTASKISGEALVKSYQNCYGINSSILRFSNVYGKFDASDRVVPLFIAQASNGQDLTIYGNEKVLDFTYIEDCVDGIYKVLDNFSKSQGMTFNIASGEGASLVDLAEIVVDKVGADSAIHVEPSRTGEIARYVADISKAQKVLGYQPSFSFEEGIEETVNWYINNDHLFEEVLTK
ncbi:NAD-dependent epimerase/dehydratase family protein [Halobacterium sp. KA-4]|uniref:NAD-dependent epimerase/dehydratase family protein n=1 Tax=Halobacterium sp. KA-4 TaxID=2896367 RepID=UPI001E2AE0D8|nr:NAD-dependent epimerase/dehydratase family protein [Halobacterium sp. KA-4]MCD2200484.1 NAD-dependent epimerase/dehydratase family protein [Halobacterium sp. KA-4]